MPWSDETLAANGKAVRENFTAWFGASQAVCPQGQPMVFYHASYRSFEAFDRMIMRKERDRESLDQVGMWFSSRADKEGAGKYIGDTFEGANIMPVYLSIQKAWTTSFMGLWRAAQRMSGQSPNDRPNAQSVQALDYFMDETGIDGIHIRPDPSNGDEFANQDVWVARRPEQIKSALGNSGLYLPDSPSLDDRQAALLLELASQASRLAANRPIRHVFRTSA